MEWIKALRGSVAGLDTAPLIYLIEENSIYLSLVRNFFETGRSRGVSNRYVDADLDRGAGTSAASSRP